MSPHRGTQLSPFSRDIGRIFLGRPEIILSHVRERVNNRILIVSALFLHEKVCTKSKKDKHPSPEKNRGKQKPGERF